jgi:hypothetical protein
VSSTDTATVDAWTTTPTGTITYQVYAAPPASTSVPTPVNVTQFGGAAGTFAGGRPEVNTTHAAGTAWGSGAITAGAIASNALTAAKFASGAFDAVWTVTTRTLTALGSSLAQEIWDRATSALTTVGSIGKLLVDNVNATISSRLASASYTTPPTVGAIADQVWEETLADHSGTSGSTAAALNAAGSAGDPWATALPGAYGVGTAGKIIGDNINATVSSRLATAGYTAPPTAATNASAVRTELTTELGRLDAAISTRATPAQVNTEADTALADAGVTTTVTGRIDAAISTRLATAGYTAPPSAATNAGAVRTELTTELGRIDAAVSSRSSHAAADVWTVTTRTLTDGAGIKKNTALSAFSFLMVDDTDGKTPETGLTVTAQRMLDGAGFNAATNSPVEVSNGWYKIDLSAADLNGNVVVLRFSAAGARTREIVVVTEP